MAAFLLIFFDSLSLLVSFLLGVWGLVYYGSYNDRPEAWNTWIAEVGYNHFLVYVLFIIITLISFWFSGLYTRRNPFWDELLVVFKNVFIVSFLHGIVVLVAKWPFSRFVWLFSWGLALLLIPYLRYQIKKILLNLNLWQKDVVILGAGKNALRAYRALKSESQMGFKILAFLKVNDFQNTLSANLTGDLSKINVVNISVNQVFEILDNMKRPQVVVALDPEDLTKAQSLLQNLSLKYPSFSWIPDLAGLPLFGMESNHFFSHEVLLLQVKNNLSNPLSRFLKRLIDIFGSFILLILFSPLLLFVIFRIKKIKGPAIFKHQRVGLNGKMFYCYKFRSMITNAEEVLQKILKEDPEAKKQWELEHKLKNDPRITPIGHFLRKTSLDELPQLWNVLIGDMSLVGPRPIVKEEIEKYGEKADFYLSSRPGMTGLWQVSGRNDVSYEERINLDSWYIKNWNLWYDIAILFKTISVVFGRRGAY